MGSVTAQWDPQRETARPTIGVEPFDTGFGGGFQVQVDAPDAIACELVEDGGDLFRASCGVAAAAGWLELRGRFKITSTELEAARDRLRRHMRDTEANVAEELAAQEWLTVIDGHCITSGARVRCR